jgi:alpha-galactosidase
MKIVIVGAGSKDFGRGQIVDVLQAQELRGRDVTLSLVDVNGAALDLMTRFAQRVKAHTGSDVRIESAADRREALPGANYVITSVARYRYELWEQDFRVPLAHGFRHCLGENGGPGALFHALRSFELVIPVCRDVEELCPDALLLNFTNPEARVLHAICHLTKVKAAGICHGVFATIDLIARSLGRPADDFQVVSAGMNHFFHVSEVIDKKTGENLVAEAMERAREDDAVKRNPLYRRMMDVFGLFSYPSDDHIGEYVSYGCEFSGVKWHYGRECRPVRLASPGDAGPALEDYAAGRVPLDETALRRSGEITVPIICDVELDRGEFRPAVNVLNTGLYIQNLSPTGVIEVPAVVDRHGIHPITVGPLPEPIAAMIRLQHSIHDLLTEAYRTGSRRLLLQALLLDPVVDSIGAAERMLDDMLELQRDFLPTFR